MASSTLCQRADANLDTRKMQPVYRLAPAAISAPEDGALPSAPAIQANTDANGRRHLIGDPVYTRHVLLPDFRQDLLLPVGGREARRPIPLRTT